MPFRCRPRNGTHGAQSLGSCSVVIVRSSTTASPPRYAQLTTTPRPEFDHQREQIAVGSRKNASTVMSARRELRSDTKSHAIRERSEGRVKGRQPLVDDDSRTRSHRRRYVELSLTPPPVTSKKARHGGAETEPHAKKDRGRIDPRSKRTGTRSGRSSVDRGAVRS